jgi:hypothetical protein
VTTLIVRPLNLDTLHLAAGSHHLEPPDYTPGEICWGEALAWMAGEPWSYKATCVCPVLNTFGVRLNDLLGDDKRQRLIPYLIPSLGTRDDGNTDTRRLMAMDWAVRVATPMWLDAADQAGHAATLRALAPIATWAAHDAARPVVRRVRDEMWKLRSIAFKMLRERAPAAAAAAAVAVAAAAAAADAVSDAAADAVSDASADAVSAAVSDAADWSTTYAATKARIEARFAPTIDAVHESAIELLGRMVAA